MSCTKDYNNLFTLMTEDLIMANSKTIQREKLASTELKTDSHGWPTFPGDEKPGLTMDCESS